MVDTRELERAGPSYTVETLRALREVVGPLAPLAWLLGADAFRGLPSWHDWTALAGLTWSLGFAMLPLFNRDRLRAGDLVAGTWVRQSNHQPGREAAAERLAAVMQRLWQSV